MLLANAHEKKKSSRDAVFSTKAILHQHIFDKQNIQNNTAAHRQH